MYLCIRPVSADIDLCRVLRASKLSHHILGEIDQYRTRPAGSCNIERFLHDTSQILPVADRHPILGDAPGDTDDIYFLERVIPDQMSCHLSCKTHQGNTVIIRRRKSCDQIRRPWPAGNQTDSDLSCRPGISICFMHQGHFLPWQDHLNIILLIQLVADIDGAGARIAEYRVYPFLLQCLHQ